MAIIIFFFKPQFEVFIRNWATAEYPWKWVRNLLIFSYLFGPSQRRTGTPLHTAFMPLPDSFCSIAEQGALDPSLSACWPSISSPHCLDLSASILRLTSKQCTGSPLKSVSGACSKRQSLPLLYVMKVFTWLSIFLLAKNIPFIPATWEKLTWLKNTSNWEGIYLFT